METEAIVAEQNRYTGGGFLEASIPQKPPKLQVTAGTMF